MEVLSEQALHNLQAATALARAVTWKEVSDVQKDFIGGSIGRMSRLGELYQQYFQAGDLRAARSPGASRTRPTDPPQI